MSTTSQIWGGGWRISELKNGKYCKYCKYTVNISKINSHHPDFCLCLEDLKKKLTGKICLRTPVGRAFNFDLGVTGSSPMLSERWLKNINQKLVKNAKKAK